MTEVEEYKVVTLPAYCEGKQLKGFTYGGSGSFLYDQEYANVFEIIKYSEEKRSWFIGEIVVENGALLMVTRVDPVFLVLPDLISSKKLFKTLQDIIGDEKGGELMIKIFEANQKIFSPIVETKDLDGERYYRVDEKKLMIWLKAKVNQIIKSLRDLKINVSTKSTKVTDFSSARADSTDESEYVRYALNLLSKYLPDDLKVSLREAYGIKGEPESEPEPKPLANSTPKGQKRPIENTKCEPIDNYCTEDVPQNGPLNGAKKQRMTKSQKELEKASKLTGVRSISSFFTKKPAKAN